MRENTRMEQAYVEATARLLRYGCRVIGAQPPMSRPALQVLPSPATADDLMLPGHGNTVLSCLLNQPAATEELYDLSRDDFIAPTQKIIFDAIADVHGAGTPVNILSVTDRLRAKGQLEQVGGAA